MQKNDVDQTWVWESGPLRLFFAWADDSPACLTGWDVPGRSWTDHSWRSHQPVVELLLRGSGRAWNNTRLMGTVVAQQLRYVSHESDGSKARLTQEIPGLLRTTTTFRASQSAAAVQVVTTVKNLADDTVVIEALPTIAIGALIGPGESETDLILIRGRSEQLAEYRWSEEPMRSNRGLADVHSFAHANQFGRGCIAETSHSTWSTGGGLPMGVLFNDVTGSALAWQIEHNGPWHWEVVNRRWGADALALLLSGPTDLHHQCAVELAPGAEFVTVPASLAFASGGAEEVIAELTRHRRWERSQHPHDDMLLVYNDYMNTVNGNPSEEVELSLIEAAAAAGADAFCIDAGWYGDPEVNWWPAIGDWEPSSRRFPRGLEALVERIKELGMRAGLWVEPEQVGVTSAAGQELPAEAFMTRGGVRVREHDRWFLDLRNASARDYLDGVMRRLIEDLDFSYFKFDYNVTPGSGTDADGFTAGAGLLAHNRGYLEWFEALRRRYPHVGFENCSSGAMRSDFAQLSRFDLQSTSDQQNPLLYPVIAAGAPMMMPPEVAGNWAYPQPEMSAEEIAFTMVTGMSGRLYLSGFLDRLSPQQLSLVTRGMNVYRSIAGELARSVPSWPDSFPTWDAPVVSLVLDAPEWSYLFVWSRVPSASVTLDLGVSAADVETLYPTSFAPWSLTDTDAGIRFTPPVPSSVLVSPSARVFRFRTSHG